MRTGIFWICDTDQFLVDAAARLKAADGIDIQVSCFARTASSGIEPIVRSHDRYEYQSINDLVDVYNLAVKENLDFAIVSFGRGVPLDRVLLHELLRSPSVQECLWSFRVSAVAGVGLQNPPRLPFIDDHFIILNVNRAVQRRFFQQRVVQASHFARAGYRSAELMSMIEYSVKQGELHNHYVAAAGRDAYGKPAPLNPVPFHLCEATGFLCVYPELRGRLKELSYLNIRRPRGSKSIFVRKMSGAFWYWRFDFRPTALISFVRKLIYDPAKFEFSKRL